MARDFIHASVRLALEKDSWLITDDPLRIDLPNKIGYYEVDLGAEQVLAAEREGRKIAVEIKSLLGDSLLNQFHEVLGQYLNYRSAMADVGMKRDMYLAISTKIYQDMMRIPFLESRIREFSVKLITVDIDENNIVQWID